MGGARGTSRGKRPKKVLVRKSEGKKQRLDRPRSRSDDSVKVRASYRNSTGRQEMVATDLRRDLVKTVISGNCLDYVSYRSCSPAQADTCCLHRAQNSSAVHTLPVAIGALFSQA
jgi:hypothetical protein